MSLSSDLCERNRYFGVTLRKCMKFCSMCDISCLMKFCSSLGSHERQPFLVCGVAEPCPPEAAACLLGSSKPVNLGRVRDGPQWRDGVIVLKYVDGDLCPDGIRKKSTTIRFTCNENQVVRDCSCAFCCCSFGIWAPVQGGEPHVLIGLGT